MNDPFVIVVVLTFAGFFACSFLYLTIAFLLWLFPSRKDMP